jgi:hypothetical protein
MCHNIHTDRPLLPIALDVADTSSGRSIITASRMAPTVFNVLEDGNSTLLKPNEAKNNFYRERRSHDAVIRVYDEAGNVIETHEHKGEFKE